MERLKLKYNQLLSSLDRLNEAVVDLEKIEKNCSGLDAERTERTYRDSMIQRFEFSLDLFWKYLKIYLELELKKTVEFNAPKQIIREACKTKLITEHDADEIMIMIEDRNMTSHIYKEEIADDIAIRIPKHYKLMAKYLEKLEPGKN